MKRGIGIILITVILLLIIQINIFADSTGFYACFSDFDNLGADVESASSGDLTEQTYLLKGISVKNGESSLSAFAPGALLEKITLQKRNEEPLALCQELG